MKKTVFALFVFTLLLHSTPGLAVDFRLDPDHSVWKAKVF